MAQLTGGLLNEAERGAEQCPIEPMTPAERLNADMYGTGASIGHHPIAYLRNALNEACGSGRGARAKEKRSRRPRGGKRNCAAAARDGEKLRVPQQGRRNGNFKRNFRSEGVRTL